MSRTQLHMLMPDPDEVYQISEESNGPHGFLVGYATTVSKVFAGQPLEITWKILHQERIMEARYRHVFVIEGFVKQRCTGL